MEKVILLELYQAGRVFTTDPTQEFSTGLEVHYCESVEFELLSDGNLTVLILRGGKRSKFLYRGDYLALLNEEYPAHL